MRVEFVVTAARFLVLAGGFLLLLFPLPLFTVETCFSSCKGKIHMIYDLMKLKVGFFFSQSSHLGKTWGIYLTYSI